MVTLPMDRVGGTGSLRSPDGRMRPSPQELLPPEPLPAELSQDLRTGLFYLAVQTKAPAAKRGLNFQVYPW